MREIDLLSQFGQIDIYLFDQILRGRIPPASRIFDAGCGAGRNLVWFLRNGYDVRAIDPAPEAIRETRDLASALAPNLPPGNFRVESLEAHTFPGASANIVIASAVLHFARDDAHFHAMLHGAWRVLAPGGLFFARLASTIGIERQVTQLHGRRYLLPDGSERYLVDEALLARCESELHARPLDPLKTTVVQNQRSMSTWVLQKTS